MKAIRFRAAARPASALVGVSGALVVSVMLGGLIPSTAVLQKLPSVRESDYSASPGRVAPLRDSFVAQILGRVAGPRIAALFTSPSASPSPEGRSPSLSPRPSPATSPTPPAGLFAQRGNPEDLRVTLSAPAKVAPGVEMTYLVTVLNTGTEDFARQFTIQSHIPITTTLAEPPQCDIPGILGPNPVCQALIFPVPGTYSADGDALPTHPVTYGTAAGSVVIRPGQTFLYRFKVNINAGSPDGTKLLNHAHLSTGGMPERRSAEVTTVVAR